MKRSKLLGYGDAYRFLKISHQRFDYLLRTKKIPYQKTSSGKIFFEEDLIVFQKSRADKMKHGKKKESSA